jgi:N4-gp56 family major capsid protein
MARTGFETTSALRQTKQSAAFFKYGVFGTYFGKFLGKPMVNKTAKGVTISSSESSIVALKADLMSGPGDKVTFPLVMPLQGAGVVDTDQLEGSEEEMQFYDWSLELWKIANAIRDKGNLSQKRVVFNIATLARQELGRWMGIRIDHYTRMAMSGLVSQDGKVAVNPPSSTRRVIGGQTAAGVVSLVTASGLDAMNTAAPYLMGPEFISAVKRKARETEPMIRPIMVGGKEYYVMFIHPLQTKALKASDTWTSAQEHAGPRGMNNPLFSGAEGEWDGVIIHEDPRIETRVGAGGTAATEYFDAVDVDSLGVLDNGISAARSLFCGAQAAAQAYGELPKALFEDFDYKRDTGYGVEAMLAVGKPEFNGIDYGAMCCDTAIVTDAG